MSNLQSTQVKVTLPNELYLHLKSKAEKLGLTLASYIKNLVIDDVKDINIPVFQMSEKTEKIALKALKDHEKGKTHLITDIDKYLDSLYED